MTKLQYWVRRNTCRGYGEPIKYIQGADAIELLGEQVSKIGKQDLVIIDDFILKNYDDAILSTFNSTNVKSKFVKFGGECSDDEISRCIKHGEQSDVVIGIGGGKTIDTAKIVAYKLNARMITVPIIASTDSPTSSLGVIYTPDGIYDRVAKLYRNPRSYIN